MRFCGIAVMRRGPSRRYLPDQQTLDTSHRGVIIETAQVGCPQGRSAGNREKRCGKGMTTNLRQSRSHSGQAHSVGEGPGPLSVLPMLTIEERSRLGCVLARSRRLHPRHILRLPESRVEPAGSAMRGAYRRSEA
jgi:hypothetical protein